MSATVSVPTWKKINPDEDIISSKLLAKAVFEYKGEIHIIAVFERSEYYRFFFLFKANKRRTPRKYWKYTGLRFGTNGGMNSAHLSIEDYLLKSIYRDCAFKVTYTKPVRKKDYLIWHRRVALPFENRSATIPTRGQTFNYANAVTSKNNKAISQYRGNAIKRFRNS